jgi:hypothetical protein
MGAAMIAWTSRLSPRIPRGGTTGAGSANSPNGSARHCPVYFSQLKRSTFTGLAPKYATMGMTLRVENETVNYRGVGDYGTEIRDNVIDRSSCSNKSQRLAGNAAIATFNQNGMKIATNAPLILATLCEANRIRNSAVGFAVDAWSAP